MRLLRQAVYGRAGLRSRWAFSALSRCQELFRSGQMALEEAGERSRCLAQLFALGFKRHGG